MKFLHEMIAKKRQAQSEAPGVESPGFTLPEMSAVSPEAMPIAQSEDDSAAIIPYRQRAQSGEDTVGDEEAQADAAPEAPRFAPQSGGYDWDVSGIDLSEERAAAGPNEAASDVDDGAAPEHADTMSFEASKRPAVDLHEPHLDFGAPAEAGEPEMADHADEDPEDEPASPASAMTAFEEDEVAVAEHAQSDDTPEPTGWASTPDQDGAAISEEDEMTDFDDVPEAPATRHKSAAEAAASLARQVQQRKIWDLQPPIASEKDSDAETFALATEPAVDPEPVSEIDSGAEIEPEPQTVPMQSAESRPGLQDRSLQEFAAADAEPEPTEPSGEVDTGEDAELASIPIPSRRTAGRVKTRLLGFHKPDDESVDPISAAARSGAGEARFPVGWVVVLKGPGRGASFTLTAGASKIGRGEDQAVRLDFGDNSISRDNHAVVAYDDEQRRFFIGHGGKANLVRLNDMPVLSTEPLSHGDTIRIGETTLLFIALCGPDFSWDDEDVETVHAANH